MNSSLSSLIGKQIGWLRVNRPIVNRNANYECAAWWSEETSALGVYPLILCQDYHNKRQFYAVATLPATVTDCNFASLFCGNLIGKYNKAQDVGRFATIYHRISLPALISGTGSPRLDSHDYIAIWEHVPAVIAYYQDQARDWLKSANDALLGMYGSDDIFCSMGHYAQWAGEHAMQACEMTRSLGDHNDNGTFARLEAKNFDWIPRA